MGLPDAPLDKQNNRQLRLIIVIDEAHHYLPCKQQTLENMVREVRSKGVLYGCSPNRQTTSTSHNITSLVKWDS